MSARLNRRFKRVFAYFCRAAKVGAESGAAQVPGLQIETTTVRPILVPLFVSAFRRADELAVAMECRCYHGGEAETSP